MALDPTTSLVPLALDQGRARAAAPDGKDPARAAKDLEALFVTQMVQHMFEGVESDGIFGGGHAEQMFRSLLIDEYGKQIAKRGVGIAAAVERQLLALQEVA